jgi:hypothetical protein
MLPNEQHPQPGADVLRLEEIKARYVKIHEHAGWHSSGECFDEDVQHMNPAMLLGLAQVYRDLANWKLSYVLGTSGVTSGNDGGAGGVGHLVTHPNEFAQGANVPYLAPIGGGKQ